MTELTVSRAAQSDVDGSGRSGSALLAEVTRPLRLANETCRCQRWRIEFDIAGCVPTATPVTMEGGYRAPSEARRRIRRRRKCRRAADRRRTMPSVLAIVDWMTRSTPVESFCSTATQARSRRRAFRLIHRGQSVDGCGRRAHFAGMQTGFSRYWPLPSRWIDCKCGSRCRGLSFCRRPREAACRDLAGWNLKSGLCLAGKISSWGVLG